MTDSENSDYTQQPIPPLRLDLEPIPVESEGEQILILRDPNGYSERVLSLSLQAWTLMLAFDGALNATQLSDRIFKADAVRLPAEQIAGLADLLDNAGFLRNQRYEALRAREDAAFAKLTVRPAVHAGQSYPSQAPELKAFFHELFADAPVLPDKVPIGILAPHIDLKIGPHVYVPAYASLRDAEPDTVIVLGTSHYSSEDLFLLTGKHFETPLGVARCDTELLALLREKTGNEFTARDAAHKREHSIEFQILFLQHVFRERMPRILPVLCTSFEYTLDAGGPQADPRYRRFVSGFREALAASGRRVAYVVSVDWSHFGRKFGDTEDAAAMLDSVRASDAQQLDALARLDYPDFVAQLRATMNGTRIDGFSCISTFLDIAMPDRAALLAYDVWHEEERASAVSFAAMSFWRDADGIC